MSARIIDGKAIAASLRTKVAGEVMRLKAEHGITPGLAVVLVGNNPASQTYVGSKAKVTKEAGMNSFDHRLPETAREADLLALVRKLNADPAVHGILVQLPLPPQIDAATMVAAIDPAKDVDGFHPVNAGRLATGELFGFTAGIKMSHVAYRGEAPGVNDVLGQQIPFMFSNASVVLGNVKAGTLRGLAVTTAKRMSFAPEIPTIAETLPDFEAATWFALVAPAGTPRDIVQKLSAEIQRLAALPDTQARFADLGMTSEGSTPEALDAVIKSEIVKWAKVIKDANVELQ